MTEAQVLAFFQRYQDFFSQGLRGQADLAAVTSSYADTFVAASPAGVTTGQNDAALQQLMQQGFERYRRMGTQGMALRHVRLDAIDAQHGLAHVGWTATYARANAPDVAIDFELHYLLQDLGKGPRIFGWVSGDEEALLREHGITDPAAD